jgi:hypothetical protein
MKVAKPSLSAVNHNIIYPDLRAIDRADSISLLNELELVL